MLIHTDSTSYRFSKEGLTLDDALDKLIEIANVPPRKELLYLISNHHIITSDRFREINDDVVLVLVIAPPAHIYVVDRVDGQEFVIDLASLRQTIFYRGWEGQESPMDVLVHFEKGQVIPDYQEYRRYLGNYAQIRERVHQTVRMGRRSF